MHSKQSRTRKLNHPGKTGETEEGQVEGDSQETAAHQEAADTAAVWVGSTGLAECSWFCSLKLQLLSLINDTDIWQKKIIDLISKLTASFLDL